MAARFMRRGDGPALKKEHAVRVMEEISKQVNAGRADVYQLQFTVDDSENLKGLLVFNLGTEWDTFETLHNMNKEEGLETQVVDIMDETEVWAEGDIDFEGDADWDEDEFRKMMSDISQQTDVFERRKSILERRNSLQQTRRLSRRESIAFDEELKKLDQTLIPKEEDEDELLAEETGKAAASTESPTVAASESGVDEVRSNDNKKKHEDVDEEDESSAKKQRKISFSDVDQVVPADNDKILEEDEEQEDISEPVQGTKVEGEEYDAAGFLINKDIQPTKKVESASDEDFNALSRPSDNAYLNDSNKHFDRSKFEQKRRESKLDVIADDDDDDMIFAVLRRMRSSARKVVARQDHLSGDLTEQKLLQKSPYMAST